MLCVWCDAVSFKQFDCSMWCIANHLRPRNRLFCRYMYSCIHCLAFSVVCLYIVFFLDPLCSAEYIMYIWKMPSLCTPKKSKWISMMTMVHLCWLFYVLLPSLLCIYDDFDFSLRSTLYRHTQYIQTFWLYTFISLTYLAFASVSPIFLLLFCVVQNCGVVYLNVWFGLISSGWFSFVRVAWQLS